MLAATVITAITMFMTPVFTTATAAVIKAIHAITTTVSTITAFATLMMAVTLPSIGVVIGCMGRKGSRTHGKHHCRNHSTLQNRFHVFLHIKNIYEYITIPKRISSLSQIVAFCYFVTATDRIT